MRGFFLPSGRFLRRAGLLVVVFVVMTQGNTPARSPWDPEHIGRWSKPFEMPTVGIHSVLLRTGEVMMFGYMDHRKRYPVTLWDPATNDLDVVVVPRARDPFCSGHSVLANGKVFIAGGTGHGDPEYWGARGTDIFDPVTREWSAGPTMKFRRWYPTVVEVPDGRTLVFSGHRFPESLMGDTKVKRVEAYNPRSGVLKTLPRSADKKLALYPRLHALPSGHLFQSGIEGRSRLFDPESNKWTVSATMSVPKRLHGTSVLLPGLDRVMALGGRAGSEPLETAEIIDLDDEDPKWVQTSPMRHARIHANAVLLPDASVMVVGGGQKGYYEGPVPWPERFDPESETWETLAPQTTPRIYHSTALLLPDGRVLSAGQDSGATATTFQIYSPPYLFSGERPVIDKARTHLSYGDDFSVRLSEPTEVSRVALVRPGSVTHSVNFDQRFVDLDFSSRAPLKLNVSSPDAPEIAPPGWYMLFVTDAEGVPSVAKWVKLPNR